MASPVRKCFASKPPATTLISTDSITAAPPAARPPACCCCCCGDGRELVHHLEAAVDAAPEQDGGLGLFAQHAFHLVTVRRHVRVEDLQVHVAVRVRRVAEPRAARGARLAQRLRMRHTPTRCCLNVLCLCQHSSTPRSLSTDSIAGMAASTSP